MTCSEYALPHNRNRLQWPCDFNQGEVGAKIGETGKTTVQSANNESTSCQKVFITGFLWQVPLFGVILELLRHWCEAEVKANATRTPASACKLNIHAASVRYEKHRVKFCPSCRIGWCKPENSSMGLIYLDWYSYCMFNLCCENWPVWVMSDEVQMNKNPSLLNILVHLKMFSSYSLHLIITVFSFLLHLHKTNS